MDENKNGPAERQLSVENSTEAGPDAEGTQRQMESVSAEKELAIASKEITELESQVSEAESPEDQSVELPADVSEGFNNELATLHSEASSLREQLAGLEEQKQKLDKGQGGEVNEAKTEPENIDHLHEVDLDSLLVDLPIQAKGKEEKIKALVDLDLYKFGSLREIAKAQNFSDSDPVVTDTARKIQDQLWDKRVENLKPEFQLVMKSDVVGGRDAVAHLFSIGEQPLHAEIDDVKQEERVLEQRISKLSSIPEKDRGPADKGHLEFAQTEMGERKNYRRALESIGRTPGFFELTDQWSKGDASVKKETEQKIEQLLSK